MSPPAEPSTMPRLANDPPSPGPRLAPPPPPPQCITSNEVFCGTTLEDEDVPIADIMGHDTSEQNKLLWKYVLPPKVKLMASKLLALGLLEWDDLLEDGNLVRAGGPGGRSSGRGATRRA